MIVRRGGYQDVRFLRDMLHHAYYWRWSASPRHPRRRATCEAWGRPGDTAVIALDDGFPVGAAWYRLFPADEPGYGYVDEQTPELAIAVVPSKRGHGIGDALLRRCSTARGRRATGLSLSVERENPARSGSTSATASAQGRRRGDSVTMVAETDDAAYRAPR